MERDEKACFYLFAKCIDGSSRAVKIDEQGKKEVVGGPMNELVVENIIGIKNLPVIMAIIGESGKVNGLVSEGSPLQMDEIIKFLDEQNSKFAFQRQFNTVYKAAINLDKQQKEEEKELKEIAEKMRKYKQDCNKRRLYLMVKGKLGVAEWTPIVRCEDPHSIFKDKDAKVVVVDQNPEHIQELTKGIKPSQDINIVQMNDKLLLQNTAGETLSFEDVTVLYNLDANQQKINDIYTNYMIRIKEDNMNLPKRYVLRTRPFNKVEAMLLDKKRQEEEREEKDEQIKKRKEEQHKKALTKIMMFNIKGNVKRKKELNIEIQRKNSINNAMRQAIQNSMMNMPNFDKEQIIKIKGTRSKRTNSFIPERHGTIMLSQKKMPKKVTEYTSSRIMSTSQSRDNNKKLELLPQQLRDRNKKYKAQMNVFYDELFLEKRQKDRLEQIKFGFKNENNINIDRYNKEKHNFPRIGGGQG